MSKRVYFDIPSDLAFLFDPGETPWAELPDIVARPAVPLTSETIGIDADFTIAAGEAYVAESGVSTLFLNDTADGANHTLTNEGIIWVQSTEYAYVYAVRSNAGLGLDNSGDIIALSKYSATRAVEITGVGPASFNNEGNIIAISVQSSATGVYIWSPAPAGGAGAFANSGLIEAWSTSSATGLYLSEGHSFENTGTIRAQASNNAWGIRGEDVTLSNTGLVEAIASVGEQIALSLQGDFADVTNSGTIRGQTAILFTGNNEAPVSINNTATGLIDGNVTLESSINTIDNAGIIDGDVRLGRYDDSFQQAAGGRLTGSLHLGAGHDAADMGDGDDTVFGESGDDVIYGRGGDDLLDGGGGADLLNGGSGEDTADYSNSNLAVLVDLQSGTASGGHAAGDTLVSIENLRGSVFADELIGDANDNRLMGDGGDDILRGGAGNDTALYSGQESDYSVVHNADGTITVTDLRNGSPDGTDTLHDIENLEFGVSVTPSSVVKAPAIPDIQAYLFDGGELPWTALPNLPARPEAGLATNRIFAPDDAFVESGDVLVADEALTALFYFTDATNRSNLVNSGQIWIQNESLYGNTSLLVSRYYDAIINHGDIISLSTSGHAYGLSAPQDCVLANYGNIYSISASHSAVGYYTSRSVSFDGLVERLNAGLIEVWAGDQALGIQVYGGEFVNSGTVRAQGLNGATGFDWHYGSDPFADSVLINSGLIEAHSETTASIGVNGLGIGRITNSGTIRADIAINVRLQYSVPSIIQNLEGGLIEGDIIIAHGAVEITNSGMIVGDMRLGNGDDSYTQDATGRFDGTLYLEAGHDTAIMGGDDDVVFGGAGDDVIRGHAGDDWLSGGRGADTLDGGAGSDFADYSDAYSSVEVNLATGVSTRGDAIGDSFIDIENIRGSVFDDELTGDGGANILIGDGGNDILRGGAGEDTAAYAGAESDYSVVDNGDGSTTVTDLRDGSPDGTDTLYDIEHIQFGYDLTPSSVVPVPPVDDPLAFLFDAGEEPWAPLPTIIDRPVGGLRTDSPYLTSDYTLEAWESLITVDGTIRLFNHSSFDYLDIVNRGQIWSQQTSTSSTPLYFGGLQSFENYGDIVSVSRITSWAVIFSNWGVLDNYGSITAISAEHNAIGFASGIAYVDLSCGPDSSMVNAGTIEAWAGGEAHGVYLRISDYYENTGTIRAVGAESAVALYSTSGPYSCSNSHHINNSGLIEAIARDSASIGVSFGRGHYARILDNSGTIRADIAISAEGRSSGGQVVPLTLNNLANGLIDGDIQLNDSNDTVINAGTIIGNVFLGDYNDSFTQTATGHLDGVLDLGEGDDTAEMNGADDVVFGGAGNDSIRGYGGHDRLAGGAGADTLDGGGGRDYADYGRSETGVTVDLSTGTGSGGDAEGDTLIEIENIIGSDHDDELIGDDGDNALSGGRGNDILRGGAGEDIAFYSGLESDYSVTYNADGSITVTDLRTGSPDGTDTLYDIEHLWFGADGILGKTSVGTDGNNRMRGSDLDDFLSGAGGIDFILGGGGSDTLSGGDDNDVIGGGDGDDTVDGDDGNDKLYGNDGDDLINGGSGHDVLVGGNGGDTLNGGIGNDKVRGGHGDDVIDGGDGNDTLHGQGDNDTIYGGLGDDFIAGGQGDDTLHGEAGADRISGGGGNDIVNGGGGNDIMAGQGGDDTFTGGAGDDRMDGGGGQSDRAVFSGNHADYSLSYAASSGWVYVTDLRDGSPDGADRLLRVEYLEFADGEVAVNGGAFDFTPASALQPAARSEAQLPGPDIMDLLEDDLFVDLSRDAEFDGLTVLSAGSWHDGMARLIESDELPALNDQSEAAAWAAPSAQPPANDPDIPVIPDDMWA